MKAEPGKVYKCKTTDEILGDELFLGKEDTVSNYEQVDKPVEETIEVTEV